MSTDMHHPRLRRLLRFRFRTMLVVITLLCILLGAVVWRAERQKAAVAWVELSGGRVGYDATGGKNFPGPDWLCTLIGIDYFASVVSVDFQGNDFGGLTPLADLAELEDLSLNVTPTTDLSPLISSAHLRELGLVVVDNQLPDLSPVAMMPSVEHLSLMSYGVNDLTPLARLTNLKTLILAQTHVRDISPLAGLTHLEVLSLFDTDVNDLAPLAKLSALYSLDLRGMQVCDLSPLATLNLEDLAVGGSLVSDDQIAELKKLLPNCRIGTE